MKSIPLLLYLVSAGLFGFAGWTVYEMLPLWKAPVREAATRSGQEDGTRGLALGKGQGPTVDWTYHAGTASWWAGLKEVNLIGKLPPPPDVKTDDAPPPPPPPPPVRPLEEIIELVSIAHDGKSQGRGGYSHVIVRYKPEANVQPPEWYMLENAPPASGVSAGSRDVVAAVPGRVPGRPGQRPAPPPARPATPLPTSMVGREIWRLLSRLTRQPTPRKRQQLHFT